MDITIIVFIVLAFLFTFLFVIDNIRQTYDY